MIDLSELRHALADAQRRLDDLSDALADPRRAESVAACADVLWPVAAECADLIDDALPAIERLARVRPRRRASR